MSHQASVAETEKNMKIRELGWIEERDVNAD